MSNGSQDYGTGIAVPAEPTVTKREYDLVVADYEKLRKEFTEYQDEDRLTHLHRLETASLEKTIEDTRRELNILNGKIRKDEEAIERANRMADKLSNVVEYLLEQCT